MARAQRWRVLEFARPHCPFSFAAPAPTEAGATDCVAYNQRVIAWLAAHPEVAKVFVSNNARLPMAERGIGYRIDGRRRRAARAAGVGDATCTCCATRRRTARPRTTASDRALRRKRTPFACVRGAAQARARARPDGRVARCGSGATSIDLTPFFCSPQKCFPVVGGVLVHKDQDHLTQDFARDARAVHPPRGYVSCWMRIRLPAGSRTAQSRTP